MGSSASSGRSVDRGGVLPARCRCVSRYLSCLFPSRQQDNHIYPYPGEPDSSEDKLHLQTAEQVSYGTIDIKEDGAQGQAANPEAVLEVLEPSPLPPAPPIVPADPVIVEQIEADPIHLNTPCFEESKDDDLLEELSNASTISEQTTTVDSNSEDLKEMVVKSLPFVVVPQDTIPEAQSEVTKPKPDLSSLSVFIPMPTMPLVTTIDSPRKTSGTARPVVLLSRKSSGSVSSGIMTGSMLNLLMNTDRRGSQSLKDESSTSSKRPSVSKSMSYLIRRESRGSAEVKKQ